MRDKIEQTKAYRELSDVFKIIYSKSKMVNEITRELEVAKEIGIDKYNYLYSPRPYKLNVITELLANANPK